MTESPQNHLHLHLLSSGVVLTNVGDSVTTVKDGVGAGVLSLPLSRPHCIGGRVPAEMQCGQPEWTRCQAWCYHTTPRVLGTAGTCVPWLLRACWVGQIALSPHPLPLRPRKTAISDPRGRSEATWHVTCECGHVMCIWVSCCYCQVPIYTSTVHTSHIHQ